MIKFPTIFNVYIFPFFVPAWVNGHGRLGKGLNFCIYIWLFAERDLFIDFKLVIFEDIFSELVENLWCIVSAETESILQLRIG